MNSRIDAFVSRATICVFSLFAYLAFETVGLKICHGRNQDDDNQSFMGVVSLDHNGSSDTHRRELMNMEDAAEEATFDEPPSDDAPPDAQPEQADPPSNPPGQAHPDTIGSAPAGYENYFPRETAIVQALYESPEPSLRQYVRMSHDFSGVIAAGVPIKFHCCVRDFIGFHSSNADQGLHLIINLDSKDDLYRHVTDKMHHLYPNKRAFDLIYDTDDNDIRYLQPYTTIESLCPATCCLKVALIPRQEHGINVSEALYEATNNFWTTRYIQANSRNQQEQLEAGKH